VTKITFKLKFLFVVLLLVQAGCSGLVKTRVKVPQDQRLLPAKDATAADLLQGLQEKSKQIETLKGTMMIELTRGSAKTGVLDEYRQTKGYVAVDRPAHIMIKVQAPIVLSTLAVMVSDGQEYRLSIPIKSQFVVENIDAPVRTDNSLSSLRPSIFLDALFVDVTPYVNNPNVKTGFEEAVVGTHSYYVFSFYDTSNGDFLKLIEKIWVDRTNLEVGRKQIFGKDGRLEEEVEYEDYATMQGITYPKTISFNRPVEEISVKLTFSQTTMNEKLDEKLFELPRPDGYKTVHLTK
jgi:outer membrane lipoprotein-sorting protein